MKRMWVGPTRPARAAVGDVRWLVVLAMAGQATANDRYFRPAQGTAPFNWWAARAAVISRDAVASRARVAHAAYYARAAEATDSAWGGLARPLRRQPAAAWQRSAHRRSPAAATAGPVVPGFGGHPEPRRLRYDIMNNGREFDRAATCTSPQAFRRTLAGYRST